MVVPLLLIGFITGMLLPLAWASLPPLWLILLSLALVPLAWPVPRLRYLIPLALGLVWACLFHHQQLAQRPGWQQSQRDCADQRPARADRHRLAF